MKTFDDESLLFDIYRNRPSHEVRYFGNYFRCRRIEKLTRSKIFSKSWIDSSAKSDPPPDFHNDKHKIMMEFMRVDDSLKKCQNNSFKKQNNVLRKYLGNNYKNENKSCTGVVIADTSNNDEFNYKGYMNNLERVITKHSENVDEYRKNYPKCKTVVFLVCDESNSYIEVEKKEDLCLKDYYERFKIHYTYADKKFIDIVKKSKADYIIWFGLYKDVKVDNKKVIYPRIIIFDVKNFKFDGFEYNEELMMKIVED